MHAGHQLNFFEPQIAIDTRNWLADPCEWSYRATVRENFIFARGTIRLTAFSNPVPQECNGGEDSIRQSVDGIIGK